MKEKGHLKMGCCQAWEVHTCDPWIWEGELGGSALYGLREILSQETKNRRWDTDKQVNSKHVEKGSGEILQVTFEPSVCTVSSGQERTWSKHWTLVDRRGPPTVSPTFPSSLLSFSHRHWFTVYSPFVYRIANTQCILENRGCCLTAGAKEAAQLSRAKVRMNSDFWLTLRILAWTHSLKCLWMQRCLCLWMDPWRVPEHFSSFIESEEMVELWRNIWFQGWGRKVQDELGVSFSPRKYSEKKKKNDGNLSEEVRSQSGRIPLCWVGDGFIIKIDSCLLPEKNLWS